VAQESMRQYDDVCYSLIPGFGPLLMDLVVPNEATAVPVIVYIHGGGFTTGSHRANRDHLLPTLIEHSTARGIAVASVQYRLSGEATFPAPLHDIKAAVRWTRDHAEEYGLDGHRIAVFGESAGGYFAAMLATTAGIEDLDGANRSLTSSAVTAAVSWYGPTHLPSQPPLGPPHLGTDPSSSPESRFLGSTVSTVLELAEWASPVTHVSCSSAPILLVHGTADRGVPIAQSERLHAAYAAVQADSEVIRVPDSGHGFEPLEARNALMATSVDYLTSRLMSPTPRNNQL